MTDPGSATIRLIADEVRRQRYPARLWVRGDLLEVDPDSGNGRVTATVVDGSTWPAAAPDSGPVLVSVDVLASLLRDDESRLTLTNWVPLIPADVTADVAAARQHVSAGAIGAAHVVDITVPLGLPPAGDWDVDHISALSPLEALVFGMRIAELVADATVATSWWLREDPPTRTVVHRLDNGVPVVHHIVPAGSTATTAFEGVVLGESGRLALRQQFAPGSVGLRRTDRPGYTFPAVDEDKHDVQAPDSAGGGWEMSALLRELVMPGEHGAQVREHAVRLVRHARRLDLGDNDDH